MSPLRTTLLVLFASMFGLLVPRVAAAQAPRVLLVRPPGAAKEVSAALVRVQGELVADGFEVVSLEAAPGATSAMAMEQAEARSASTTVGLFLSADGKSAELWVVDRLTNKTVVRRVSTTDESENRLPEVLALKAVELLRASLLELVVERNAAATPKTSRAAEQHASEWAARPLVSVPHWAIETGAAAIWSPREIDAAFVSVARGRFAIHEQAQVRVSFAGLGTRPQVRGTGGSAQLQQWYGVAEGLFTPLPKLLAHPVVSIGAGMFHSSVKGEAAFPYQALQSSGWAFAADVGVGLGIRLASRLELSTEAHAMWLTPKPVLRFAGDDGPHIGEPSVVGSLTLIGWL
ncbi:MAG TPA: hypothetical protein VHV51_25820 [Polyangiaceae bacterium]|nr:hypothetical protein [Polyangiaceae bacterium]